MLDLKLLQTFGTRPEHSVDYVVTDPGGGWGSNFKGFYGAPPFGGTSQDLSKVFFYKPK